MGEKNRSVSARARARERRQALAAQRRAHEDMIESHQVAYFAACDEISGVHEKIVRLEAELAALKAREDDDTRDARRRAELAMGALVVDAGQPVEDVAVLLDVSEAAVKRARSTYRKHRKNGTSSSGVVANDEASQDDGPPVEAVA